MRLATALVLPAFLAACGGGSSGSSPPAQTYAYATPAVNSQRVYAVTDVDNSSSIIQLTSQQTVTAVNADGSFVRNIVDPNGTSVVLNGTTYSIVPGDWSLDATGHDTAVTFNPQSVSPTTCTYTPHGLGPVYPLTVGETWQLTYTYACQGGLTLTVTQTGQAMDVETVTVPAGSYSAIRLQSTVTWTTAIGTQVTETLTRWADAGSGQSLRETSQYAYGGTLPPNGHLASQTVVLQSAH
jgi:hypothetical protein